MSEMEVVTSNGRSELLVGRSVDHLSELCNSRKTVVITDASVERMYGEKLKDFDLVLVNEGEKNKTLIAVEKIYERLLELGVDRSFLIVGVGGGIVCDITGFVASTFMRGLTFGLVPTTLLAQVDASIGGKNGVNLKGFKNLIGTIKQPEFCLIDFNFLRTLPRSELMSGLAEIVKSGAIADYSLFNFMEANYNSILSLKEGETNAAIRSALLVKINIVRMDETENWERMKLNFGHSVGHAIEKVVGIPHGHAISIGMVAAGRLSVSKGLLSENELRRIIVLLQNIGLPVRIRADKNALMEAITKDKKRRTGRLNMVLLKGIGNAVIVTVNTEEVTEILNEVCV